jgi:hypothetical protein
VVILEIVVLGTISPGLAWTSILLISVSQVAGITGMSHHAWLGYGFSWGQWEELFKWMTTFSVLSSISLSQTWGPTANKISSGTLSFSLGGRLIKTPRSGKGWPAFRCIVASKVEGMPSSNKGGGHAGHTRNLRKWVSDLQVGMTWLLRARQHWLVYSLS